MDRSSSRFTYAALFPLTVLFALLFTGAITGDTQGIAQDMSLDRDDICSLRNDDEAIADVHEGRFCTFSAGPSATCETQIKDQLVELDTRMPDDRFELIDYGTTHLGESIQAVRIGNLADASPENPVPQIVFVGTQHAREWISAQIMMELIHYFSEGPGAQSEMLNQAAVTIMPVNNPDGYNYTFTDERFWRMNRWECPNGNIGVDPNRNYPFSYNAPGNDPECSSAIHRGPAPGSEPETQAGRDLVAAGDSNGAFETVFVLNVHAFGNIVLASDGFTEDFETCSTNTNCSNADLGAQYAVGGTRAFPKFVAERGLPFKNGQTFRSIYAAAGDMTSDTMFGQLPNGASNPMSITLEIGDSSCGFQAEYWSEMQYQYVVSQQIAYAEFLLDQATGFHDGSYYDEQVGTFTLPHIHRRLPDAEHPTLRIGARNTERGLSADASNGDKAQIEHDDVLNGVAYNMWRWMPTADPFQYPRSIEICPGQLFFCRELVIGGSAPAVSDTIDLCDPRRITASSGWAFVGRQGAFLEPKRQCYWNTVFDSTATTFRTLEMEVSLVGVENSTLTFSYDHGDNQVSIIAQATTGEFTDCTYRTGTCRNLFNTQWRGAIGWVPFSDDFIPDPGFRTEVIDLSDYDGQESVKIRFQLVNAPVGIGIYDPVVTGWAVD